MTGGAQSPEWDVALKEHSQPLWRLQGRLEEWLRQHLGDPLATVTALRIPEGTGVANETVMFDLHRGDGRTDGLVLRLAPAQPLYLDFDLATHYRMYETLSAFPSVPSPAVLGYEPDAGVLGAAFFVMERIDGVVPADTPSYGVEGFIVDATPAERRVLWERSVRLLCEMHRLPTEPFHFLKRAHADGVADCLEYWRRARRWAEGGHPTPLMDETEEWLVAHRPQGTGLSWGDSRLPNIIYRDLRPVALLDWDLVSLAGPQADLAWWILMEPPEVTDLDGMGSADEMIEIWQEVTGQRPVDLHWFLVFGAYRLGAIFTKLFSMMFESGKLPLDMARALIDRGHHVQAAAGLLDLKPPEGLEPWVPQVSLDRCAP